MFFSFAARINFAAQQLKPYLIRWKALSAGTNKGAEVELSESLLTCADIIFTMEKTHLNKLRKKFKQSLKDQKLVCLNIPDDFDYMDETLIRILQERVTPRLLALTKT